MKTDIPKARKLLGAVVSDLERLGAHGFVQRINNALALMTRHPRKSQVMRSKTGRTAAVKARINAVLFAEAQLPEHQLHTDIEIAVLAGLAPEAAGRVSEVRNGVW